MRLTAFPVPVVVSLVMVLCATASQAGDEDPHCRAGHPQSIKHLAVPSDTGHYIGYYVGGGGPCLGRPPAEDEGVWGWDYSGVLLHRKVVLRWFWKDRYQGGAGAYHTDGPQLPGHRKRE